MNVLIVPAYLRSAWDASCLQRLLSSALLQASLSGVIVVDDASPVSVPSANGVERIVLERNGGAAVARNAGLRRALALGADNILMADHDCVLQPGWAAQFEAHLARSGDGAAGGLVLAWGKTLLDSFHDLNGTLNGRWVLPDRAELLYAPTCNFAIRREVAQAFRFDERFPGAAGEDVDFCLRIRRKYRIGFCRGAVVRHDFGYSSTLTGLPRFIRTFQKYKAANARLWEAHAASSWTRSESIPSGAA